MPNATPRRVALAAGLAALAVTAAACSSDSSNDQVAPSTAATPGTSSSSSTPPAPTIPAGFTNDESGGFNVALPTQLTAHTTAELAADAKTFSGVYPDPIRSLDQVATGLGAAADVAGVWYTPLDSVPRNSDADPANPGAADTLVGRALLLLLPAGSTDDQAITALGPSSAAGPIGGNGVPVNSLPAPTDTGLTDVTTGYQSDTDTTWCYLDGTAPSGQRWVLGVNLPSDALGGNSALQDYQALLSTIRFKPGG